MKQTKKNPFFIILCTSFVIIISTLIIFSLKNKSIINPITNPNGCQKGGCSGQLCVDTNAGENTISTCEWKEVYKCAKLATCERQKSGQCGFTSNPKYQECLKENKPQLNKLTH